MVDRLAAAGFAIDYPTVLALADDAVPNRVHIALALLRGGYVQSTAEAFETLLAEGGGYYRPAEKANALEVITLLRLLGILPVHAHPLFDLTEAELRAFLPAAKAPGLMAMETIYALYSPQETRLAAQLAEEFKLLPSGGSDFHGTNKPDIALGRGKNNITVPFEIFERLRDAAHTLS